MPFGKYICGVQKQLVFDGGSLSLWFLAPEERKNVEVESRSQDVQLQNTATIWPVERKRFHRKRFHSLIPLNTNLP